MSPLTGFILFVVTLTTIFSIYTYKILGEPLKVSYQDSIKDLKEVKSFWLKAEIITGRLAMLGFIALFINYGIFGSIIPIWL